MADDGGAAGPKSGADGEFTAASESAGDQQAGDVGAADEEQDGDGGGEDPELRAQVANDEVTERCGDQCHRGNGVGCGGIVAAVLLVEDREFGVSLGDGGPGREACGEAKIANTHAQALRGHESEFKVARREDLGLADEGEFHTGRQDADDGMRDAVEGDGCAEDVGVAAEARLPESVAENDYGMAFGTAFIGREGAAERGAHAEHREKIWGDAGHGKLNGFAGAGEVEVVVGPC